jgi:hypothetical protein
LDQLNLATEPQAGLANLALLGDDLEAARTWLAAILDYLETGKLDGTLEPLRVYLTCVQVLQALKDERAATLLDSANLMLHQQAYRIQEPDLKEKFFASPYAAAIQALQVDQKTTKR